MKNNNRINFPDEKKISNFAWFISIFYLFILKFYVSNESVLHALWQRLGYRSAPAFINQPTNQKAGSFPKSNVHLDFFGGIYILLKKNWKKMVGKKKSQVLILLIIPVSLSWILALFLSQIIPLSKYKLYLNFLLGGTIHYW